MQKFDYWRIMLADIHEDTEQILEDHLLIFKEYVALVNAAPKKVRSPFNFHDFVRRQHGVAVALFIRRQLDTKYNSLYHLLSELIKHHDLITYQWFLSEYKYDWASADFKQFTKDGIHLDSSIPTKDRKLLTQLGSKIDSYVDQKLAHRSNNTPLVATFNDIDKFLKEFETILKKYILLFTGSGYTQIAPIYQYEWRTIFYYPWVKKDNSI